MTIVDRTPGGPSTLDVHRLLDEAFAGVEMTPEVQDLKEEMRADLVVRVAEFERSGLSPGEAARRAVADLGDVRSVVDETRAVPGFGSPWAQARVRPRPAFVVRTVVLAVGAAAALAIVALGVTGVKIPMAGLSVAAALLAIAAGVLVADALRQETTSNYPLPRPRSLGYGAAAAMAVAGIAAAALYLPDRRVVWLVAGALPVFAAVIAFTYLGATQTNRHKPWVVRLSAEHEQAADRFTRDPAAAARFGVYTVTIWIVAFAAFVVLGMAVSWAWSWLALVGGLVFFFLTLARMLFVPESPDQPTT